MRPRPTPLDIVGRIEARSDDQRVWINADHSTITIDIPSYRIILTGAGRAAGLKRVSTATRRLGPLLHQTDLTVAVRLRAKTIAVLGAEAHPGFFSRLLRLAPLEIRIFSIISSLWR